MFDASQIDVVTPLSYSKLIVVSLDGVGAFTASALLQLEVSDCRVAHAGDWQRKSTASLLKHCGAVPG